MVDQPGDHDTVLNGDGRAVEDGIRETVAGEPVGEESPLEVLQRELQEAQAAAESHLDQWRRTAAEFSNYKKRTERERIEFQKAATAGFIQRLLPALDDLDRAFDNLPAELDGHDWVNGIRLVRQKMNGLLDQEGVEVIDCEGARFDPELHDAITYEESRELDEGQIIDVLQRGYRIGDRILRPAQVRVAR